ncbi:ABC transporter permease [Micromonospora sp. CPCC 205371]|nr:ABC transporter permease [Micromonospora sp. CPCC 205371]
MGAFDVALGVRLTLSGSRVRLLMMVGGVAAAVALMLGISGALPAAAERIGKTTGRGVEPVAEGEARAEGVRARLSVGLWRGHQVRVLLVAKTGSPAVAPPGVPRTPAPGEVFVSPALAAALAGPRGAELAPRLPGKVAGTVAREGLVGPDELYAVAGASAGALDGVGGFEGWAADFAKPAGGLFAGQSAYVDGTGMRQSSSPAEAMPLVLGLAAVGLITPLLVLVGTSTRLSAAARERRASAMRLVGAAPRQLRRLGAVEGAIVGVLGAVAGLLLFYLLRAPVAAAIPIPDGLYAGDVAPPLGVTLATILGVPVLTAAAGVLSLRRALSTPLAARRQVARSGAGLLRLAPLAAGLLALSIVYADRGALATGAFHAKALLFGGGAACLVGLAIGAAALSRVAGALLARWGPGLASQFAGRRLLTDPAGAARTITGTALVVVVVGWLMAFLPMLTSGQHEGNGHLIGVLPARTVVVTLADDSDVDSSVAGVRAVPGVTGVVAFREVTLLPPGAEMASDTDMADPSVDQGVRAVVADCAALGAVLGDAVSGCRPGTVQRLSTSVFEADVLAAAGELAPDGSGPAVPLPGGIDTLTLPGGLTQDVPYGFAVRGDLLVPPALLAGWDEPGRWFPTLLVATDGREDTVEAVRTGLGATAMALPPTTPGESAELARSESDGYRQAALIAALAVVLTGGLSLAVTTADAVRERYRVHAALTAMGTPARLLRRGVLLHTAVPLLLNIGLAILVTAATSWLYVRVTAQAAAVVRLPWAGYAAIGAAAVVASLLATAAVLPFVRAATRPDALRTE